MTRGSSECLALENSLCGLQYRYAHSSGSLESNSFGCFCWLLAINGHGVHPMDVHPSWMYPPCPSEVSIALGRIRFDPHRQHLGVDDPGLGCVARDFDCYLQESATENSVLHLGCDFGQSATFLALEVTLLQALLYRVAVLEHPAPPDPERIPSIWYLNATRAIRQLSNYTEVVIYQGLFGAVSPKPTCLGITSCTDPAKRLSNFETTSVMPPPLKMGRGGHGREEFTTAQLKEYPEGLSRGLAQLSIDWWTRCSSDASPCLDEAVDAQFSDFVRPFTVLCTEVYARGADTRGGGGV